MIEKPVIDEPVIITSAVYPAPNVFGLAITDPKDRLLQLYCSLLGWLYETNVSSIVLCDNTADPTTFSPLIREAESRNVDIEVLHYMADPLSISKFGKGFGEGEILSCVMENSRIISASSEFYKITGRQYVKNYNDVNAFHKDYSIAFRGVKWATGAIDTRFYKCNVEFYKTNLIDCYKSVRDRDGIYLEHVFGERLSNLGTNSSFGLKPSLVGYSGSIGTLVDCEDYNPRFVIRAGELIHEL